MIKQTIKKTNGMTQTEATYINVVLNCPNFLRENQRKHIMRWADEGVNADEIIGRLWVYFEEAENQFEQMKRDAEEEEMLQAESPISVINSYLDWSESEMDYYYTWSDNGDAVEFREREVMRD